MKQTERRRSKNWQPTCLTALSALAAVIMASAGIAETAYAQDYDLVINNGRVIDPETMLDAVLNVGVKDGRTAVITENEIEGETTIDATGHVVASGFIDTHCHSVEPLGVRLLMLDGVTTCMDLEAGATDIDEWYAKLEGKWPVNAHARLPEKLPADGRRTGDGRTK